jgi:hypothetical protein
MVNKTCAFLSAHHLRRTIISCAGTKNPSSASTTLNVSKSRANIIRRIASSLVGLMASSFVREALRLCGTTSRRVCLSLYPYASGCSSPERYESRYERTFWRSSQNAVHTNLMTLIFRVLRRIEVGRIHARASFGPHGSQEETGGSRKLSSVRRKHGDTEPAGVALTQIPRPHFPAPRSGEPYLSKSVAFGNNATTCVRFATISRLTLSVTNGQKAEIELVSV